MYDITKCVTRQPTLPTYAAHALTKLHRATYSRETFTNLKAWLTDARALASPDLHVVLVGNKIDQEEQRQVSFQEVSRILELRLGADTGLMLLRPLLAGLGMVEGERCALVAGSSDTTKLTRCICRLVVP